MREAAERDDSPNPELDLAVDAASSCCLITVEL